MKSKKVIYATIASTFIFSSLAGANNKNTNSECSDVFSRSYGFDFAKFINSKESEITAKKRMISQRLYFLNTMSGTLYADQQPDSAYGQIVNLIGEAKTSEEFVALLRFTFVNQIRIRYQHRAENLFLQYSLPKLFLLSQNYDLTQEQVDVIYDVLNKITADDGIENFNFSRQFLIKHWGKIN